MHIICEHYLPSFIESMSSEDHVERILANHWQFHFNETVRSLLQQQSTPQVRLLETQTNKTNNEVPVTVGYLE